MPSTPFGEHLKRERELRGVTLEEVAAATRISPRFLEAIENEQWDRLPGGAFNRGFIRSVARYLGLDEENMVAEYALETRGLNESAASPDAQGMPRDWRPVIKGAIVLIAVIVALALGIHYYRARARARQAAPSQNVPVTQPNPALPPTSQPTTPTHPVVAGGSH
jgi:cytoskeleton protein RodZ